MSTSDEIRKEIEEYMRNAQEHYDTLNDEQKQQLEEYINKRNKRILKTDNDGDNGDDNVVMSVIEQDRLDRENAADEKEMQPKRQAFQRDFDRFARVLKEQQGERLDTVKTLSAFDEVLKLMSLPKNERTLSEPVTPKTPMTPMTPFVARTPPENKGKGSSGGKSRIFRRKTMKNNASSRRSRRRRSNKVKSSHRRSGHHKSM